MSLYFYIVLRKIENKYSFLFFYNYKFLKLHKMSQIKYSSIPNEYYLGDLPGTLQYTIDQNDILNIDNIERTPLNGTIDVDRCGFELVEHSYEYYSAVIPNTTTGINNEWNMFLLMKKMVDGEIWLKAALRNKKTGKIALMTSTNNINNLLKHNHRAIKSLNDEWFIGHYRMSAPMFFWRELQNRLKY